MSGETGTKYPPTGGKKIGGKLPPWPGRKSSLKEITAKTRRTPVTRNGGGKRKRPRLDTAVRWGFRKNRNTKRPLEQFVRQVARDVSTQGVRWEDSAIVAVHMEELAVKMLMLRTKVAQECAFHDDRISVMVKNM